MENESCDVSTLIPEGCEICENEANEQVLEATCTERVANATSSDDEGKYTDIVISSQTNLIFNL